MKRAAVERQRTVRVWRQHLSYIHGNDPDLCVCELQPGRFRKHRISGCGRPRCYFCHADKLCKRPTFQQRRSDVSFHEWKREARDLILMFAGRYD